MTNEERLREVARGAIERSVAASVYDGDSADTVYTECYAAALRALLAADVPVAQAEDIASTIAQEHAQP